MPCSEITVIPTKQPLRGEKVSMVEWQCLYLVSRNPNNVSSSPITISGKTVDNSFYFFRNILLFDVLVTLWHWDLLMRGVKNVPMKPKSPFQRDRKGSFTFADGFSLAANYAHWSRSLDQWERALGVVYEYGRTLRTRPQGSVNYSSLMRPAYACAQNGKDLGTLINLPSCLLGFGYL